MTDRTISLRVSDALYKALNDLAHEHRTSMSEVARSDLRELVSGSPEVPDHLREQVEREKRIERNRLDWQRIHFASNVAGKFRRAFEQGDLSVDGLGERAVEDLREIYVEEAAALFESDERQEAAVEYVEALADHAAECADASEFDRLDPAAMFDKYSGVEEARKSDSRSNLTERAADLLDQGLPAQKVMSRLQADYGVTQFRAKSIVQEVQNDE